jgi:hypothetical protein
MAQFKRQVNDILDLWVNGATIARIASVMGIPAETVEYVIDQYGVDVL